MDPTAPLLETSATVAAGGAGSIGSGAGGSTSVGTTLGTGASSVRVAGGGVNFGGGGTIALLPPPPPLGPGIATHTRRAIVASSVASLVSRAGASVSQSRAPSASACAAVEHTTAPLIRPRCGAGG
jgi:hypothetical protein